MKKIRNLFISLFAMAIAAVSIMPNVALATDGGYLSDDYMYTVRVYSGAQGDFSDGDMIEIKAAPGTIINLSGKLANIKMAPAEDLAGNPVENKYYAKGIRESGKDNNTISGTTFRVNQDIDYVVAYGLKGGDVQYTVRYVDASTGKDIIPEVKFYGNVGEKPVVSFQYIEGYVPQALNLTRTLTENPSDNIFTFKYTEGDSSAYRYITRNGGIIDEGTTDLGTTNNGTTGNNANGNNANGTNANNQTGNVADDIIMIDDSGVAANGGNAPAGLLDLDDNSTPLADFGLPFDYSDDVSSRVDVGGMPMAYRIGIGVLAAGAATGIGFLVYSQIKKKKEEGNG